MSELLHDMTSERLLLCACVPMGAAFLIALFGVRASSAGLRRFSSFALWAGFAAQSAGLYLRGAERAELPFSNVFEILQMLAWGVVATDATLRMTTNLRLPVAFIAGPAFALAAFSFANPAWDGPPSSAYVGDPWTRVHVAVIVLSFSLFAALALNSAAYLAQHRSLSRRRPGVLSALLPPLRQLDRVGEKLIGAGLSLFTLALAIGVPGLLGGEGAGSAFKLVVAAVVWFGYLALFIARRHEKISGRGFACASGALFLLSLFSLWPANAGKQIVVRPAEHRVPGGAR